MRRRTTSRGHHRVGERVRPAGVFCRGLEGHQFVGHPKRLAFALSYMHGSRLVYLHALPSLDQHVHSLFSMLAARHKVVKCGQYAPRIRRPRACVCACHPATMPLAAVRRSAAGLEAGSARRRLVQQEEDTQQRKKKTRRGRAWDWTGFGDKTAWDWMQLLIVPVMLAVGALLFNLSLNSRQLETEERRAAAQIEAEDQRAQEERLQTYLEQMGTLLIDEGLLDSEEDDEARYLARARTLAVLRRADDSQKRSVVEFLAESGLAGIGPLATATSPLSASPTPTSLGRISPFWTISGGPTLRRPTSPTPS